MPPTQRSPRVSRRAFLGGAAAASSLALIPATAASASAASHLAGQARSRPLVPSDRQGFNRRWYAPHLEAVYVPHDLTELAPCLEEAFTLFGSAVKVVSGRHCYEGFVYGDETRAIIDMSAIAQAGYDPDMRAYFVDAGSENWAAYRSLLNSHGKTLPAGSCYSVGAGGHIAGGGYGLLSRVHGLTVDHVTAIEVATWDASNSTARLRHVSQDSTDVAERDLLWALRGAGGGNFGAIGRFYFADLPDAPTYASLWSVTWDWSSLSGRGFADLVAAYSDWMSDLPDRQFTLLRLNHVAAQRVSMLLQVASGPQTTLDSHMIRARRAINQARDRLRVVPFATQSIRHMTYLEAVQDLNGSGPNRFGKYKSSYMNKAFPADQVDALQHWLNVVPSGVSLADMQDSLVQVDSYGGAVNSYAPDSSPIPQRSSIMKLQFQTYWDNSSTPGQPAEGRFGMQQDAHLSWIEGMYADVYAAYGGTPNPRQDNAGTVDGCYYNYPDVALGTHADGRINAAMELYFGDNFRANQRNLVNIKQQWDPQNYFRHAQSVPVS